MTSSKNLLSALSLFVLTVALGVTEAQAQVVVGPQSPYSEDFESGPGGWTSSGALWELATPAIINIVGAASGANAWVTDADDYYANSSDESVVSPVFDFSLMAQDPIITFQINYYTEQDYDGARLEMDLGDGNGFQPVGVQGPGWYNGSIGAFGHTGAFTDISGGYITVSHPLTGAAAHSNVVLRMRFVSDSVIPYDGVAFDDVSITSPALFPGSGEDLLLSSGVNGSLSVDPQKSANVNDQVTLLLTSPGGTLSSYPYLLAGHLIPTGSTLPYTSGLPEVQLDPNAVVVLADSAGLFGTSILGTTGVSISFTIPISLPGTSAMFQGYSLAGPAAANGFFAAADAHELMLN